MPKPQRLPKFHVLFCLGIVFTGGCGAGEKISAAYNVAFPDQPVSIDDVMVLDVINAKSATSVTIGGGLLRNTYELKQPRQFTIRLDEDARSVKSATLFNDQGRLVATIPINGKPTQTQPGGNYTLEVVSVAP